MDSDVSAEGDFENESPRNRSSVSSNSEGHQSCPASPAKNSDNASSSSDGESSPNAKRDSSSDRESSPEAKDSDASDKESSPDVKNNAGSDHDSSPDAKNVAHSDRESSPEAKDNESDRESSPERKHRSDRESSPDLKNNNDSDRERSPSVKNASPPTGVTSPENGVWPSSPSEKPSPPGSTPVSPQLDDYDSKEKNHVDDDRIMYENINGDVSPKSAKRSNSVGWESRSDIASSLDSVSPSQFERQESSKEFNDKSASEKERSSESKKAIIDFADDLSDVSDIESNDSFEGEDNEHDKKEQERHIKEERVAVVNDKQMDDAVSLHVEGEEQLDFEAEEGECSPKIDRNKEKEEAKKEKELSDLEEGELTDDNDTKPEETERPVCRFFSRGHCTWGSNCRFIHPGVMDKGNYSMFETVRPIITPGGPPPPNSATPMMYPVFPPHLAHSHAPGERPGVIPTGGAAVPRKDETPVESAWERGLRQAKEMIRKSSKRKETEVDFEDKKMNLTLSQDEIDKENDYYSRHSGSPVKSPDGNEKWKLDSDVKSHRGEGYSNDHAPAAPHAGAEVPSIGYYPPIHHGMSRPDYWGPHRMGGLPYDEYGLRAPPMPYGPDYYSAAAGRRYMHPNSYYPPRPGNVAAPPSHHPEFYDRKPKHKQYPSSSREVIVQKNDKPYKDDSPTRYRNRREDSPRIERARDDEWADPWMRTKSPASGRRRRRKDTYSSGSSYSSSSESSRSSSRSSFSSKSRHSRSRSKAHSSGSHSQSQSSSRSVSESQTRKKPPMQFKLSPSSRSQLPASKKTPKSISPTLLLERRAATERAMHMNPPPPSPKIKTRPHSPPAAGAVAPAPTASPPKSKAGLPDRLLAHSKAAVAAAMARSASRSSKSSSESSSSDSSSDSSDSSASSSSTSKSKTPPVRAQKRNVADDHVNVSQNSKNKAMDALKLSGQKQQIKLTLKGSGNTSTSKRAGAAENSENRKDRSVSTGKKRVAESSDSGSDSDGTSPAKKGSKQNSKKGGPSRREELLKQLRAVEDAIARKRSKIL